MRLYPLFILLFALLGPARARGAGDVDFSADFYQKDLTRNSMKGRGNAWVKSGDRQVWTDDIEIDFTRKVVIANGNVHIKDGPADIWCSHASYALSGEEGTMDNAVLVKGQMVLTGATIRKLNPHEFEADEGTYSNCNTSLVTSKDVADCRMDWRLYGRKFTIKTEGYVQFYDALVYVRDLPVLYSPYFIVPAKSKRQSGFLLPYFSSTSALGSGTSLPYFLNLGDWQDLTLVPTFYSKTGYHALAEYRYNYDPLTSGRARVTFTERRFSPDFDYPVPDNVNASRILGIAGEGSVSVDNQFPFLTRGASRQTIRLVTNPYFTQDYSADLGVSPYSSYLRSQITGWLPGDSWLETGMVRYFQPMIISKDTGVDRGAVIAAPALTASRMNSELLGRYLSYELDFYATNFARHVSFDQVPSTPALKGTNADPNSAFDGNDYLRSGQRAGVEGRLVANVPLSPGLQLQPALGAGALIYHFDPPVNGFVDRQFVNLEVPFSLYLSRKYDEFLGLGQVYHVFQPRVLYSVSPYQRVSDENHPFFHQDPVADNQDPVTRLSNPRFNLKDQFFQYEFTRFEIINRFRRPSGSTWSRFLLLQVSQQLNLRTSPANPRFQRRLGPIELYGDLGLGPLSFQLQANYNLEITRNRAGDEVRENTWSGAVAYRVGNQDYARANVLFRNKAERDLTEQSLYMDFAKTLPIFFDITGGLEYSLKIGELRSYSLGLTVAAKPVSCWGVTLTAGRDSLKRPFASLSFRLNFGSPGAI